MHLLTHSHWIKSLKKFNKNISHFFVSPFFKEIKFLITKFYLVEIDIEISVGF